MEIVDRIQSYGRTITYAPDRAHVIEPLDVGELHVSGHLVVMDAFWPLDDAFVEAGRVVAGPLALAVRLSTIEIDDPWEQGARLRLVGGVTAAVVGAPAPPVRWESAFGEDRGVPVDFKSIALLDDARVAAYQASREREDGDPTDLMDHLDREVFTMVDGGLVVRCGEGDGVYGVWLGYDEADRLTEIVIDLEMFDRAPIH